MRYHSDDIHQFLTDQAASGQSVTDFCSEHDLKVPTFYAWRKKYAAENTPEPEGFCKIVARREKSAKKLRLPSGMELDLVGITMPELADLIVQIDRANA